MTSVLFTLGRYTPGQKFAHWEHKGVKLRVEVGPREAARKRCTLAKTFQAGVPARRLTGVEVGSGLPGRLKELAAVKVEGWEEAFEVEDSGAMSAAATPGGLARGDDLEGNLEAPAEDADDEAGTRSKKSTKP